MEIQIINLCKENLIPFRHGTKLVNSKEYPNQLIGQNI